MNLKRYSLFALAFLVLDWGWGMAQVRGLVPLWSTAVLNFPFGLPFTWLEYHWAGTRYSVAGHTVDELWSMGLFFFMILAQAALYCSLFGYWQARRRKTARA